MNSKYFKAIRLLEDMKQVEFSKVLNISTSHVGMIEAGRRPISAQLRAKVYRTFPINDETYMKRVEGLINFL